LAIFVVPGNWSVMVSVGINKRSSGRFDPLPCVGHVSAGVPCIAPLGGVTVVQGPQPRKSVYANLVHLPILPARGSPDVAKAETVGRWWGWGCGVH
jgi:hypothetical protein